jgi:hypothetical protein
MAKLRQGSVVCGANIKTGFARAAEALMSQRQRNAESLKQCLLRIIDAIRYLCAECDAIFGHKQSSFCDSAPALYQQGVGKFLNLMNLLAEYDGVTRLHLEKIRQPKNS